MIEVQSLSTASLQPNDYNPNAMGDEAFAEFVAEVRHLGHLPKPVVVRPDGDGYIIIDGEHGWRAAKEVGFDKVPCEVINADDFESMRQSYKRNQHGTHNPVLLGRMFRRMLEARDLSQRALADEIEVSEGTIRNALLYADASEMRNSYAFEKLSVRQVRTYVGLPRLAGNLWLDCGADLSIFGDLKHVTPWGFPASIEQVLCMEDYEPFLPLLQDLCYIHNGKGFSAAIERMLAFLRALSLLGKEKTLTCDDTLPYLRILAKVRWQGEDPDFMEGVARKVLSSVFRMIDDEVKPAIPLDTFEAWTIGPGNDEWSNLSEFEYGLNLLVGKHSNLDTMTQNLQEELMARELEGAPDYIKNATEVSIRERYVLMSLTADAPEEMIEEAKREAMKSLSFADEKEKRIKELMAAGNVELAVKLEVFGQKWTAQSAFEYQLSRALDEKKSQEIKEYWADRDRVTDDIIKWARNAYVIRQGTVNGRPALEVLRERLDAIEDPEFFLLASCIADSTERKNWGAQANWLRAVEGKFPLDPCNKPPSANAQEPTR